MHETDFLKVPAATPKRAGEWSQAGMSRGFTGYVGSVFRYRHLIVHLALSDLRSRTRRTYLGGLWIVLNPLFFAMIFTVVFVYVFDQPIWQYAVYALTGVVVWDFISQTVAVSSQALVGAEGYMKQARIPGIVFPIRTVIYLFLCFMLGLLSVALFVAFIVPQAFGLKLLWILPMFAVLVMFLIPVAVISAIMNLAYRDYQQFITYVLMALYYLSPVFIAREVFDNPGISMFTAINPITALLDMFRDPILHQIEPSVQDYIVASGWTSILWLTAAYLLRKNERRLVFYY